MRKVNLNDIAEDERKSPKGKFHKFVKDISIALGREKDSLDLPNVIRLISPRSAFRKAKATVRIMVTARRRSSIVVVSGKGKVRDHGGITEVTAGDSFFFAPGQAHQLFGIGRRRFRLLRDRG